MYLLLFSVIPQHPENKFDPQQVFYPDSVIEHSYNVLHYDLELEFFAPFDSLAGKCTMIAQATQSIDSIPLHFGQAMHIDSIVIDGSNCGYSQIADTVYIDMPGSYSNGDSFVSQFYYQGKPSNGLFPDNGGFYTFNQTIEAAKQWYPCFDYCWDKADSGVDYHITVPDNLTAVASGLLTSVDTLSGNRLTYHWEHNYSIVTYNIAMAAYEYVKLERTFHGYPLEYYALPAYQQSAQNMLDSSEVVLELYDTLICLYPFHEEKLAQCQTPAFGGAMEHQTAIIYGLGTFDAASTHAHEIAHSWWGDALTCINYREMFLNEGTTSYFECLGVRALRGDSGFVVRLMTMKGYALSFDDTYHLPIINTQFPFGTHVYYKGAWFHHMLKDMIGDSVYFAAMKDYFQTYKWGNASVTDLRLKMEQHAQDTLEWFFHQWLELPDHPKLTVKWGFKNDSVLINIQQVQNNGIIYTFPLEIGFWKDDSLYQVEQLWFEDSLHIIEVASLQPDSISLDPNFVLYFYLVDNFCYNNLFLVDDDQGANYQNYYQQVLNDLGVSYTYWDVSSQGLPPDSLLEMTCGVMWFTGDDPSPLSSADREKIKYFIDNQIPLALFSPGLAAQLADSSFLQDTLGCNYTGNTSNLIDFIGATGDTIGHDCIWYNLPVHHSSIVFPTSAVGSAMWGSSGYGLLHQDSYNIVFSTVSLKYFYNQSGYSTKQTFISRILNYMGIPCSVGIEEVFHPPVTVEDNNLKVSYLAGGELSFHVEATGPTELLVFDVMGRLVRKWEVNNVMDIRWRGQDLFGRQVSPGRYFVILSGDQQLSKTVVLF
ncbi:MAG: M1 family metallopeptidase [bacterium]